MKKGQIAFGILWLLSLWARAQAPSPTIQVSPSVICSGHSATFKVKTFTVNPSAYSWSVSPGNGVTALTVNNDSVYKVQFNDPGRFVITMSWTFDVLGSATKTIAVNVIKSAESAFNASLTGTGVPNEIALTDFSNASTKIYWVYDNNFAKKDSASHTTHPYSSAGTFTVLHIALGTQGCNDTSSYKFTLEADSRIELPNIFTPNGDGVNDVFRPNQSGISELHVLVYNRAGVLVHEWTTVNGFWDGRTTSGVPCDDGTYMVILEAKGYDGKSYTLLKPVTLLR